jgi:3-oxoacyl-[acyl-carrier protein] reductase
MNEAPKVGVVTGGGGAIGRAISLRLAADGFGVGVLDLVGDLAKETVDLIESAGGRAVAVEADIRSPSQIER